MSNRNRKSDYQQREELSDEGKELWDKMMSMGMMPLEIVEKTEKTPRTKRVTIETDESMRMRLEMKKLQQNSRIVIMECEQLQEQFTKKEQYFKANEARVAAMIHRNFIARLQRVLNGKTAFEKDIELDEDSIFIV